MDGNATPAFVLNAAARIAKLYDRNAMGDVRFNPTDRFHLCGLIERAASFPKSGSTHRRSIDSDTIAQAKAAFCRANQVAHPSVWEWESKRTWQEVQHALSASAAGQE